MNKLKAFLAAIGIALVPLSASAVTYTTSGITPSDPASFECNGLGGNPAANIEVLGGGSFNAQFDDGDAGGFLCFNLQNFTGSAVAVTLSSVTILQNTFNYFTDGVTIADLSAGGLGTIAEIAQGELFSESFTFLIEAGGQMFFDFEFGDVVGGPNTGPDIDFTINATVVPIPAAGLLLLAGLGGLAALRRRKTV